MWQTVTSSHVLQNLGSAPLDLLRSGLRGLNSCRYIYSKVLDLDRVKQGSWLVVAQGIRNELLLCGMWIQMQFVLITSIVRLSVIGISST